MDDVATRVIAGSASTRSRLYLDMTGSETRRAQGVMGWKKSALRSIGSTEANDGRAIFVIAPVPALLNDAISGVTLRAPLA